MQDSQLLANLIPVDVVINVAFAFAGALIVNALRVLGFIAKRKIDDPSPRKVVEFLLLPLVGAILALAFIMSKQNLMPLLSMQIGATAPLFFQQMAGVAPTLSGNPPRIG